MDENKTEVYGKLLDVSKLVLPLAMVFYFFGFLTVTPFLARFGIISFDIINSRFIIAGILSSIAMAIVFLASWQLAKFLPLKKIFSAQDIYSNLIALFLLPTSFATIGNALSTLFNLGRSDGPIENSKIVFHAIGRYDFVGHWLENNNVFIMNDNSIILKYTLLLGIYVLVPILTIYTLILCIRVLKGKKKIVKIESPSHPEEVKKESIPNKPKPEITGIRLHIARFLGILVVAYLITSLLYAFVYLGRNVIDFGNVAEGKLEVNLLTQWLIVSILVFYFFTSLYEIPQKGVKKGIVNELKSFSDVQNVLYLTLIPFLISIIFFGQTIFPRISNTIGGGQPREVIITFTEGTSPVEKDEKTYFLGESSQNYFIAIKSGKGGRALQIDKDSVKYMVTRSR